MSPVLQWEAEGKTWPSSSCAAHGCWSFSSPRCSGCNHSAQHERKDKSGKNSKLLYAMTSSFQQSPSALILPRPALNQIALSSSDTHAWLLCLTVGYMILGLQLWKQNGALPQSTPAHKNLTRTPISYLRYAQSQQHYSPPAHQ